MSPTPALTIRNLTKSYGRVPALGRRWKRCS